MDMLHKLAVAAGHTCFQCGGPLVRENFSLEHKEPWLDADDPVSKYFDLENIAFSHHACNVRAARRPMKKCFTPEEKRERKNELERQSWARMGKEVQQARRRAKYERNGK